MNMRVTKLTNSDGMIGIEAVIDGRTYGMIVNDDLSLLNLNLDRDGYRESFKGRSHSTFPMEAYRILNAIDAMMRNERVDARRLGDDLRSLVTDYATYAEEHGLEKSWLWDYSITDIPSPDDRENS